MKNIILLSAIAAASIATGCATTESSTEPTARVDKEYTTGSNIPKKAKEGVSTYDREALERARDQIPMTQRPGLGGSP